MIRVYSALRPQTAESSCAITLLVKQTDLYPKESVWSSYRIRGMAYDHHALIALYVMGRFSLAIIAILGTSLAFAQNSPTPTLSAGDLVRTVVANELRLSEHDPSRWRYDVTKLEDGQNQTKRVVEMRDGSLERLIATNGKSLSVEQQKKETE